MTDHVAARGLEWRHGRPQNRGFTRCPPAVLRDVSSSPGRCLPFTMTGHASRVSEAWLHAVAASPWLYPVLYLLTAVVTLLGSDLVLRIRSVA